MESIEVPDIIPATTSDSLDKSSPIRAKDINPYVKKALHISEENFLEISKNCYLQWRNLDSFLTRFPRLLLEPTAGSGTFAIEFASRHPDWGVLAVEARYKRAVRAFEKSSKRSVKNIFIVRGRFEEIEASLPDSRFDAIYLAFPDPWERCKWSKHRLYEDSKRYERLLKSFGRLVLKTDNKLVAQSFIKMTLGRLRLNLLEFPFLERVHALRTDFEKLFIHKKQGIWLISFRKLPEQLS